MILLLAATPLPIPSLPPSQCCGVIQRSFKSFWLMKNFMRQNITLRLSKTFTSKAFTDYVESGVHYALCGRRPASKLMNQQHFTVRVCTDSLAYRR